MPATVTAKIKRVTQGAVLLVVDDDEQWIPHSLIEQDIGRDEEGEEMDVDIASWKARELGWD